MIVYGSWPARKSAQEVYAMGRTVNAGKANTVTREIDTAGRKVDTVTREIDTAGRKVDTVTREIDALERKMNVVGVKMCLLKVDRMGFRELLESFCQ
jgi:hypothetical protein